MNTQHSLALPEAPAPRSITLDQARNLYAAGEAKLRESNPSLARQLTVLIEAAPTSRRAALVLLYNVAGDEAKATIRTMRALAQLIHDNEAHASRQPARPVVTIAPVSVATAAAKPLSDSQS